MTISGPMTTSTGHWAAPTNPEARTDTHVVQNGGPVCGAWINDAIGQVWRFEAHGAVADLVTCPDCRDWIIDRTPPQQACGACGQLLDAGEREIDGSPHMCPLDDTGEISDALVDYVTHVVLDDEDAQAAFHAIACKKVDVTPDHMFGGDDEFVDGIPFIVETDDRYAAYHDAYSVAARDTLRRAASRLIRGEVDPVDLLEFVGTWDQYDRGLLLDDVAEWKAGRS